MMTRSGAKLLDFGLARGNVTGGAPGAPEGSIPSARSQTPTRAQPLTSEGTIVGTYQYMAPEQLEGKEADARTDLFAFGAVLYEMASARRAFEGRSQASLISAIMSSEPPPLSSWPRWHRPRSSASYAPAWPRIPRTAGSRRAT